MHRRNKQVITQLTEYMLTVWRRKENFNLCSDFVDVLSCPTALLFSSNIFIPIRFLSVSLNLCQKWEEKSKSTVSQSCFIIMVSLLQKHFILFLYEVLTSHCAEFTFFCFSYLCIIGGVLEKIIKVTATMLVNVTIQSALYEKENHFLIINQLIDFCIQSCLKTDTIADCVCKRSVSAEKINSLMGVSGCSDSDICLL